MDLNFCTTEKLGAALVSAAALRNVSISEMSPEEVLLTKETLGELLDVVNDGTECLEMFRRMVAEHLSGETEAAAETRARLAAKLAAFHDSEVDLGNGDDITDETLVFVESHLTAARILRDSIERKMLSLAAA